MYPEENRTPVFLDITGRRWRITENVIVLLLTIVGITLYWLTPQVLSERKPPSLIDYQEPSVQPRYINRTATLSVDQLLDTLSTKNTAVIGEGPLVRLVEVATIENTSVGIEPFTGRVVDEIPEEDLHYLGEDKFAIQKYGATDKKQVFLTFDDGPDEMYTPRLLDVLSRESVPATFFVTGSNVAQNPEITKRIINEGHSIGNHTFSHIDFNNVGKLRAQQEINQTERIIVAATERSTAFFRPPYGGNTDQAFRNSLKSILTAQQLGYTVVSFDFDSNDWNFPLGESPRFPDFNGKSVVILLHDGGGNRADTITYVEDIIAKAKERGYSFSALHTAYNYESSNQSIQPSLADTSSLLAAQAVLVWPKQLIYWLFLISIISLFAISFVNVILAVCYKLTTKRRSPSGHYEPYVTIILPAYNEEKVIEKSVQSLMQSTYKKFTIIIVDDGSVDNTWEVAKALENKYKRVTALHQENGGKSSALNNAIAHTGSEVVICVDADTMLPPETVSNLIRHFKDDSVAAVAGVVKVGNANSLITKWQALEYISGISIERNAQAFLGAIMIVPGACSAWRRNVLLEFGGFSNDTLAEDCDLALKIQESKKYKIIQDNDAISYTEAPQTLIALTKQRFRWTFGTIQSLWKHRTMLCNEQYTWLGMYVMPSIIGTLLVPIIFWPLVVALSIINLLTGNFYVIFLFFVLSLAVQTIFTLIGILLAKEKLSYLAAIPFARIIYGPIRMYILYKAILTMLKGVDVGWNKLARTGTAYDPLSAQLRLAVAQPISPQADTDH